MKKYLGIILIVLGALMLVISYFVDLVDYNGYNVGALLLIVIGLAAMIRVHSNKLAEPLFQFRIMGLNLDQIIIFIKINGSCFLPFVKSCFHEIPPKLGNFSRLKSRESGRIFRWKVSKRYRHRLKHSHRIFCVFSGS